MKNIKKVVGIIILIVFLIWMATGIYTVNSGEEAVVLRFGQFQRRITTAGLNWHLPSPIDKVIKVDVSNVRRIEFGYETTQEGSSNIYADYTSDFSEALMFTGDETLVLVETAIQYKVYDSEAYLFNVDDADDTLVKTAESAIRRVVASHELDDVLTDEKAIIQQEIQTDLQEICYDYGLGVSILKVQLQDVNPPQEVDAAFKDVVNAREDKNSYINESESYRNEIIPLARGNAKEMVNQANAYKEKRISEAKGDVAAFNAILEQYKLGKDVTRKRMYIETMEKILPGITKYVVADDGNTLKFLPLEQSETVEEITRTNSENNDDENQ